jgi:hypothetical protein
MSFNPETCEARDGNGCLGPDCLEGLDVCCFACLKRENCGDRCTPDENEARVLH